MDKARQRDSLTDLGGRYRTRVTEDGTGAVLVLVHGTPLDTRAWDPLVPLLRERRRVVCYDARATAAPGPPRFPDPSDR
jgi:pimeloyl-ACP methyl ester carboxylesterase